MKTKRKISIPILQYNPVYEKIKLTIDSVLWQEDLDYEIIIGDDGSNIDYREEICEYLNQRGIKDFKFIKGTHNRGTVGNLIATLEASSCSIVKGLSPGDFLIGKTILRDWVDEFEDKKREWSIGSVLCYEKNNDRLRVSARDYHPLDLTPYLNQDDVTIAYNYLIKNDNAFGCSVLFQKEKALEYLKKIENQVIYAEDNIYRMMVFDGLIPHYFPRNVMMYEYGSGMSTSMNQFFRDKLKSEWNITTEMIGDSIAWKEKEKSLLKFADKNPHASMESSIVLNKVFLTRDDYYMLCEEKIEQISRLAGNKDIYIYGAGRAGEIACDVFDGRINIRGFVDKQADSIREKKGYMVKRIDEIDLKDKFFIVCTIKPDNNICDELEKNGVNKKDYCYICATKDYSISEIRECS